MYKVFVNDCLIILTENKNISTNLLKVDFENSAIDAIIQRLLQSKNTGICLLCNDLNKNWKQFKKHFKIEKAAGGKVYNKNSEVLFIYRFDTWDLPKGKLEKGESKRQCALREVEEECGVYNLVIEKKLETTYHIFKRNSVLILKKTHWYLMSTNFSGILKPQFNEGITKAVFKNKAEIEKALTTTYENIKLLF